MSMPFLQLAPFAVERVLNAIPGGLAIAALAWLFLRVAGRQNSGTRFTVWFCALLAIVGAPLLSFATWSEPATQAARSEFVFPESWAVVISVLWILIAALAAMRIVVGLWKLRRLRRGSLPVPASSLTPAIRDLVAQFQSPRRIAICNSPVVNVPTAIGFFRPMILLPDWALRELSQEELKVVLLHEVAHFRRWDDWTNLAQKFVRTVFFFHPAVWWIERRLSLEREMACDELVLAETKDPQAYAECLVSLAEKSFARRGLALAQAVLGHVHDISLRLAQILDGRRPSPSRILKPTLGLATALAAISLIALPAAPRLIAFKDAVPVRDANIASAADTTPALPKAAVIPAAVRTTGIPGGATMARKRVSPNRATHLAKLGDVPDARQIQRNALSLMVRANTQPEIVAPQLLFVMQTTQYQLDGSAIWSLCVWRVTVNNEDRPALRQQVIPSLL